MIDNNFDYSFAQQPDPSWLPSRPPQAVGPMQGAQGGVQGQNLSPELIEAMLGLNKQGSQKAGIDRQRMLAQQLRAAGSQQMQGQQAGRIYVPPNLANLAANIYGGYKAKQSEDDADLRSMNMSADTQNAMRKYFESMSGKKTQTQLSYMGEEGE
jgi:hypothetical protein